METGLEGKPWYLGLGIGVAVGVVVLALCSWKLFDGTRKDIGAEQRRIADLEKKISEGRAAQQELPRFREEMRRRELELDKLLRILPPRKNTQELIRRIRSLTEQAGFQLKVFDPAEKETDREFYREWPIKIDLDGGYHELVLFFDRVSRFSRIINIENLKISSKQSGSHTISAQFTAKTFVYKEPEPEEQAPKKPRKRGR